MRLNWKGDELKKKMDRVVPWAINSIMADCVREAKQVHPWKVRTGTLQGGIQMRVAELIGSAWVGLWGVWGVLYAIFQELGTVKMRANPFLRPAADKLYPKLKEKIKEGMAT
jgi:HK97 gp10 family phage protein